MEGILGGYALVGRNALSKTNQFFLVFLQKKKKKK